MESRFVLAIIALLIGVSLVGAPWTMADWNERASMSVEQTEESQVEEGVPVIHYGNLSTDAQSAVRRAIDAPGGRIEIYGKDDWPARFRYSDTIGPGRGLYAIVSDDQYYELTTYAMGNLMFIVYQIPPFLYGWLLLPVALQLGRGRYRKDSCSVAIAVGLSFHLLGPRFDFPIIEGWQLFLVGVAATVVLAFALLRGSFASEDASVPIGFKLT